MMKLLILVLLISGCGESVLPGQKLDDFSGYWLGEKLGFKKSPVDMFISGSKFTMRNLSNGQIAKGSWGSPSALGEAITFSIEDSSYSSFGHQGQKISYGVNLSPGYINLSGDDREYLLKEVWDHSELPPIGLDGSWACRIGSDSGRMNLVIIGDRFYFNLIEGEEIKLYRGIVNYSALSEKRTIAVIRILERPEKSEVLPEDIYAEKKSADRLNLYRNDSKNIGLCGPSGEI